MKQARKLFTETGVIILIPLLLMAALRQFVLVPFLGKVWSLLLRTTPDGFISNANIAAALAHSPWIVPMGLVLMLIYCFLLVWDISVVLLGIGFHRQGTHVRAYKLLYLSLWQVLQFFQPKNWIILVLILFMQPLLDFFSLTDIVQLYVLPEYIADFVHSLPLLKIAFIILCLWVIYLAVRWMYLLPAFVLKKMSFMEARRESLRLTHGRLLHNIGRFIGYSIMELLRLGIIPMVLYVLSMVLSLFFMRHINFPMSMFRNIQYTAYTTITMLVSAALSISQWCFIVQLYNEALEQENCTLEMQLPEVAPISVHRHSVTILTSLLTAGILLCFGGFSALAGFIEVNSPELLDDLLTDTQVIAHKGYSSKTPENTMAAFEMADESAAVDMIELDVWSSEDGIPVVIHNETITDATGLSGNIYDYTYEELQAFAAPYHMDPQTFADSRIPSLEEALAAYGKSTPILIEIKGAKQDPALPRKVVELMEKYDCTELCQVQSGDYNVLKAVKQVNPDIKCGLIMAIVSGFNYDLPYADFFSVEHDFVSDRMVQEVHLRGKGVYVWTVNYLNSAKELQTLNVDAVITDYPDDILPYFTGNEISIMDYLRHQWNLLCSVNNADTSVEAS